jgi:chromosome segregation ATPase
MKRKAIILLSNTLLAAGLLLTACNSSTEKDRKELARAEEEALEKAEEANKLVPQETDSSDMADVKKDLEKASQKLSEKQEKYLASLREKEGKLNDRLKTISEKLRTADGSARKRLTEKQDKLIKERDQLQANILEIQSPLTDQQLETVQKEINVLIAVIDRELSVD